MKKIGNWRLWLILFLIILFGAAITSRLFFVQVLERKLFSAQALGQQTAFNSITGSRGQIFCVSSQSTKGSAGSGEVKSLAINKDSWTISVNPNDIADKQAFAEQLSGPLGLEAQEILSDLGSQDAIGAGGRYNNLIKGLGGPDTGGIGFAFGVERLLLASKVTKDKPLSRLVFLITLGEPAKSAGVKILNQLRASGIPSEMDYLGRSLKAAMRAANDAGARYVLILGEDELKKNVISLKDMLNSTQKEINIEDLTKELK